MWLYSSDAEDLKSDLTYEIVTETNTAVIDCYISSNRYVACYNSQQVGYSDITVKVTDTGAPSGIPESDTDTFRITVEQTAFNNPPTISGIPDKSIQVGQTISQIDLYDYASDNEDPDSALTYEIQSQSNSGVINCYIHNSWSSILSQ